MKIIHKNQFDDRQADILEGAGGGSEGFVEDGTLN